MYVTKVPVMLDSPTNGCLLIASAKQHMRYAAAYMHVCSWGLHGIFESDSVLISQGIYCQLIWPGLA